LFCRTRFEAGIVRIVGFLDEFDESILGNACLNKWSLRAVAIDVGGRRGFGT
jgi:hypothetical protein